MIIDRYLKTTVERLSTKFPVVSITGPRQSGKTTLIKDLYKDYKYFNLENLEFLNLVENDPAGFIKSNTKVIIDEVQKMPKLLSYIQVNVDERKLMGDYILSGSQNLLLSQSISQSLAGRSAYVTLLPFSYQELQTSGLQKTSVFNQILTGFYPAIYDRDINPSDYFNEYLITYVERDIRQIINIVNLAQFRKFLGLLAGRVGQILNLTSLANDVGVSHNTIEGWISVLEASYIVYRLPPYFGNFGKRLIKSPKVYFYDTGLACRLLNISSEEELKNHSSLGNLFENLIISEVQKYIINFSKSATLYFYRDSNRNEVDLVVDTGVYKIPVEIKSSGTFSSDFLKGINNFISLGEKVLVKDSFVVYTGDEAPVFGKNKLLSWNKLNPLFECVN